MTITINGTGSITGLSAGGLPNASITQADLAPNVAGNGPAFSAYNSILTACASGAFTLIALQVEEYDTGGFFDSTTNYRFQPTVAGYYQLNGCVVVSTDTAGCLACIFKNGTENKRGVFGGAGTSNGSVVSAMMYFNGISDYADLRFYQSSGSSKNTGTGVSNVYFQGFLARAA